MNICSKHQVADKKCRLCNPKLRKASGSLKRSVRPRLVNQYLAQAATERVARRVQEIEGRWDEPASLDMKATIYHEILEVLNNGVEV